MGGKAKLLDTIDLEQLHEQAATFKRDGEGFTEFIRFQLNQLSDPISLDCIKAEHGEECLLRIHSSTEAVEELLELVGGISGDIESKIAGAIKAEADKKSNYDKLKGRKATTNRLNLKR